jgi:signal transduction histidine kinase
MFIGVKLLKLFLRSKILLSIWLVSFFILTSLFFFIPYITERNLSSLIIENSKNSVEQIKLTRTYYLNSVVNDIKNNKNDFIFLADHINNKNALPLPATIIHDLSDIYSKNSGLKFRTYSKYPFTNRINRKLSKEDLLVLEKIKTSEGLVVTRDTINDKQVIKVAIADYMSESSCVTCHNNHKNRTWDKDKWTLGDIRGVIEIVTPINKPLEDNKNMRNMILIFIFVVFFILIVYYSYMLIKREDELFKINDLLDKKVKDEIEKNRQKEQILIQKAKLSSMGEMVNSIAHQWRQPLSEISSILMNIELRHKLRRLDDVFLEKKMNKAENILLFMSNTIEDFRGFFKLDKKKQKFNLYKLCKETLNILDSSLKSNHIDIQIDIDQSIEIYGLKNEFSQVFLNLLVNAKEALIEKQIKMPYIKVFAYTNNETISLNIQDNALGLKKKNLQKIFDLYFTTKKEGSGIGLYISKLIIEKHFSGSLEVENNNEGALFIIRISEDTN